MEIYVFGPIRPKVGGFSAKKWLFQILGNRNPALPIQANGKTEQNDERRKTGHPSINCHTGEAGIMRLKISSRLQKAHIVLVFAG